MPARWRSCCSWSRSPSWRSWSGAAAPFPGSSHDRANWHELRANWHELRRRAPSLPAGCGRRRMTQLAPPRAHSHRRVPPPRSGYAARRRRRALLLFIAQHSVAIALCIMFLSPFVFIVLTSFMSSSQSLSSHYWPHSWHPGNYLAVFRKTDMPRYLWNTVLYAGLGTIFTIASSVPAAYALAKLRWPGRKVAFLAVICMMLLPPQITAVPLYSMC